MFYRQYPFQTVCFYAMRKQRSRMHASEKFKESLFSVSPIMAIVVLLHWTVIPLGETLWSFLVGGALLIVGLSIFLLGTDIAMVPIGQKAGAP